VKTPCAHNRAAAAGIFLSLILLALVAFAVGCKREERDFHGIAAPPTKIEGPRLSELQPGQPTSPVTVHNGYEESAFAMSEGKRLYSSFNCVGCHAHGGGSMGPPLMDAKWRYGSRPDQIYASIMEGRPNGMPSFRGKIVEQQTWQLVAYVRSLSGLASKDAAPARDDHLKSKPPENSMEREIPKNSEPPK
jgi:cytochrome c oxidase cbb3-type subunit 3